MDTLNKTEEQVNQYEQEPLVSKISLIEERLNIDVRQVETGKVQLHKKVIAEEITQEVPVTTEEIQVERKAINQYVETTPATRYDGNTTIISVVKEVLVVEKKLMLVEEVHITKKQTTSTTTVSETLLKEEVEISRIDLTEQNTITNQ